MFLRVLEHFSLARSVLEPRMAMRGFGFRFLRMSLRHDHMKNALDHENEISRLAVRVLWNKLVVAKAYVEFSPIPG